MQSDTTPKALSICLTTFRICISVAPDFRMATMLGIASPTPRACPVAERERDGRHGVVGDGRARDRTRSQYSEQLFKILVLVANPTDCPLGEERTA